MAKKVSTNKITNLSQDWGLDTSNGLPYSGQSVQDFIKEGLATANTAYSERWGAVYFDSATYTLLGFKNEDDKETYLAGGDSSLVIGREIFNFSGTINQIKIINKMNSNTVYFTNTAETANLTVGFISQQKGITDQDWTEILEDFYVTISVDKGSTGEFVNIETNKLVLNGFDYTFDVKKYVAFGGNRVRVTATGVTTNTTTNFIFNVHSTSMYLSPSNFAWNKPFVEGEAYNLGGMNIGGNINKLLKVKVTNDELDYSRVFEENLKTATYITNSYFYKGLIFPETGTGVYHVEIWLDADGLESDHLHYNIMCIASADKATASLININEVFEADNGTDADLFKYSIYNAGMASGNPYFKISKDGEVAREETLEGVPTASVQTYSAALEFESEEAMFDILVDASIGDYHQQATVTIDNTTSFPAVADATFYMNAATRSNNQTNRDKFINEISGQEISTTFSNIAWVDGTDGWTVDKSGRKCLLLPARSKMTVNTQPLALIGQGKTIEMAFKVENAADYNEPIVSIADTTDTDFRGIVIKPKNVCVHSRDLHTNDLAQSYNLKDDELVHLIITIVKNYKTNYGNLAQIYVNGVKTTSFSFTNTDDFTSKASLVLGSNTADLYVYKMRVYENGFGWQDSIQNYINCLPGVVEKVAAWDKISSVIDDSYNLDYDAVFGRYNTMVIEMLDGKPLPDKLNPSGDNPPLCNLEINIVDRIEGEFDEDFAQFFNGTPILNQTIEGQGTTAMTYYRWNFRWKMDKKYNKRRITAKKNVASSMHSHKMGATRLYNDLHNAVVGFNDANARVAVFQYPVYGFLKTLVEGTTDQYVYTGIGLYTIGPDKGDKVTFGYDQSEFKNSIMHLEGTDHTPMSVGFDYPWAETQYLGSKEAMGAITKDGSIAAAWEVGAAGEYDPKDNPTEVKAMLDVEFKPAYEVVYNNSTCILGVTETLAEINADPVAWRKRVAENGKSYSELEFWTDGVYDLYYYNVQEEKFKPNGINLLTQLNIQNELTGLDINAKNELFKTRRRENFIANWENYWDKDDALFHDVILEIIAASDNFKKNNYPYKFKPLAEGGRWCRRQDDLDSIFDVNNQGFAAKLYSVLMGDKTATGSGSVFRGENSIFHTLVHECFKEEKKQMAHRIFDAMAELSPYGSSQIDRLVGYIQNLFWDKAQDYFTKSAYNIDAEWTYEEAWPLRNQGIYVNDVDPLQQSLGSHIEAERNWVELRMVFMASYYNWGPFATDNGDDASTGQVSFRAAGGKTYTITPALDLNPTILIGQSDLATYGDRVLAGTPVEVTVPDMGNNDTHVYIQGTDYVADLGDLSDLQVSADNPVLTVASKRLRKLKTGDEIAENVTSNVADMGIGYCPSLEEIDSRNLASLTGTVDLTQCPRLRKVLFEGTNVANLQIPAGSKIEELSLPDTVTTLSLIRLPNLTEDNLKYNSLNALSYLRLEDNDSINNFEMLKNAYINSPVLKNIRVVGFKYNADANDIAMIARFTTDKDENGNPVYQGIDDNGDPTLGLPVLDGTFILDGYLYEDDYNAVKANYPKLNIEAEGFYIKFEDPEVVKVLLSKLTTDDNIGITVSNIEGVKSIGGWFTNNAKIETFNEFERFTGITKIEGDPSSAGGFMGCTLLRSIKLPKTLTTIYDGSHQYSNTGCFKGCTSLEEIVVPPLVTKIPHSFARSCSSLRSVTFEGEITSIADRAFCYCTPLVCDIPQTVTNIGIFAFRDCDMSGVVLNLPNLKTLGGIDTFAYTKIKGIESLGEITALTFQGDPPGSYSQYPAFYNCTELEYVNLPKTLTNIGRNMFQGCTKLVIDELDLPNLTTIGVSVFSGVKIRKVKNLGKVTTFPQLSCVGTYIEEINVPDTVTAFASSALYGFTSLHTLNVDWSKIVTLNQQALYNCTGLELEELSTPNLETIGSNALYNVKIKKWLNMGKMTTLTLGGLDKTVLTELVIPSTVISLPKDVLSGCKKLVSLSVDWSNITSIGANALYNCTELPTFDEVNLINLTSIGLDAFYGVKIKKINISSLTTLPTAGSSGLSQIFGDKTILEEVILSESLTEIPNYCFMNYSNIKQFGINWSGLTVLGAGALNGMSGLEFEELSLNNLISLGHFSLNGIKIKKLSLPTITSLPAANSSGTSSNFGNNSILEELNLSENITILPAYTFKQHTKLKKITGLKNIGVIEMQCFNGCSELESIDIDFTKVTTISNDAFSGCTSIIIDELNTSNITTLGTNAFSGVKIKKWLDTGGLTTINLAGLDKNYIEEIVLPQTATIIPAYCFQGCPELRNINNGVFNSITEIKANAFCDLPNWIQNVVFPNLTTVISTSSSNQHLNFVRCGFTEFHAPNLNMSNVDIYYAGNGIFKSCPNLKILEVGGTKLPLGFARDCPNLENVIGLDNIVEIRHQAFIDTPNLKINMVLPKCEYIISSGASSLGGTFGNCGILSLDAPKIIKIGEDSYGNDPGVFNSCKNLHTIKLQDITKIGYRAFANCTSLSAVIINNTVPPALDSSAFSNCGAFTIYVPEESVESYKTATNWMAFALRIKPLSEYSE